MEQNDISTRIKELRAMHGLTLQQVADMVGVGKSTIRKWETGMIANMRRDKIAKLASALHTTPAYLMGWPEEEEQKETPAISPVMQEITGILSDMSPEQLAQVASYIRFIKSGG